MSASKTEPDCFVSAEEQAEVDGDAASEHYVDITCITKQGKSIIVNTPLFSPA